MREASGQPNNAADEAGASDGASPLISVFDGGGTASGDRGDGHRVMSAV
jgi:hypothetical protein